MMTAALNPRAMLGLALIATAGLAALAAPVLATHEPTSIGVMMLRGPSAVHWLGTDELGRDLFSRLVYGARTSLAIGFGAAVVATILGVPIGLFAGYLGGRIDLAVVQLIDLFIALPGLVLALVMTAMVGPSVQNLVFILGFVMWPTVARLVRGQALAIRETVYVEAAIAVGGSNAWIVHRHIWPNIRRVVAAQFAITIAFAIFTSASLSFLGLGIPPPTPDWGGMVRGGFAYLAVNPIMSLAPGTAVALTVLGFYLVGSSRD
ncbi:MAG: ABC transporter permease [Alphaproteobacteria bacterium]|nr:ABC transporter permease [Alphaproteobacteria bacterium]